MDNLNDTNNQYVIFNLENESYGIAINYVETIEKISTITRIPGSQKYVEGVINLRGEVVPVVDLRKRFGFSTTEYTDETRIIILLVEDMIIGILVDSSSEVLTIEKDIIDNTSNLVNEGEDEYISGIGKVDNRMIILLDVFKIFDIETA
ncbi:chemotaxis protein CheW [Serpentinicella sp. ANB-PHB4]|uniref:chemotaxis protein CheW n=1 Tax=Serpentinicella sp. ANB-PHB4 TaxID=3074076 RepID=UPI00285898EB|nr:chemotaxis protein CheW [Serpentinicella sp. ANB-PHB4]MDR5658244.1 chemotaxis protein CheW [Serpentinicella sp. ANB-PHB4]